MSGRVKIFAATALLLVGLLAFYVAVPYFTSPASTPASDNSCYIKDEKSFNAIKLDWFDIHNTEIQAIKKECQPPARQGVFYSQEGEDAMLVEKFFKNKRNGFYIELGALDGNRYSNTKYFEDTMGWTGVLIEPVKSEFKALKRNRPHNILINAAVCETEKIAEILNPGDAAVARFEEDIVAESIKKAYFSGKVDRQQTWCVPIGKLLNLHGVTNVDLFSVDVEGHEYQVLASMDWSIPVHVVIMEVSTHHPENEEKCREVLRKNGFVFQFSHRNLDEVWLNPNYEKQMASLV